MVLLYCNSGIVQGWHDVDQAVPASTYGVGTVVIPWDNVDTLERIGPVIGLPPTDGSKPMVDGRPRKQPTLSTQTQLFEYANFLQWQLAIGGYTITLSGQALTFPTDATAQTMLTAKAVRLSQPSPPATMKWQFATGFVTLSAADFITAANKIADFVQATFDELSVVLAGIVAGTITSQSQIDGASWPAPHA